MRRIIVIVVASLVLISCNRREPAKEEINLINSITKAVNKGDYNIIKPYLANEFHFKGDDNTGSFVSLFSYLNFKQAQKISDIEVDYVKEAEDSVLTITGEIFFKNYDSEGFELQYRNTDLGPKIIRMAHPWPHKFTVVTRSTYFKDSIANGNPVENIIKLKVLDPANKDSLTGKGYTIYFDEGLEDDSKVSLRYFQKLDSLLTYRFSMKGIEQEDLYLANQQLTNSIIIGTSSKIPWTLDLYENDILNRDRLSNKVGTTFSHEIIEGTLVNAYNLSGYEYRWFRDGLSEYIAYEYCKLIAPEAAEKYFTGARLSAAKTHLKNGNLLDWRGGGPIKEVDKGKLYGSKFIYGDEVGQYGRAFKFFRDHFSKDEEKLVLILKEIKKQRNISAEKVLDIMSEVTGKNIREVISQY